MWVPQYQSHFPECTFVRPCARRPQRFTSLLGIFPLRHGPKLLRFSILQVVKKACYDRVPQLEFKSRGEPMNDGSWCDEARSPVDLLAGQKQVPHLRCHLLIDTRNINDSSQAWRSVLFM